MATYLIRHAHAGSRSSWRGDDIDRPLSDKGTKQAAWLVDHLEGETVGAIYSSPSTRCIQTVEPLARHRGLTVVTARELAEGADTDRAVAFLLAHADERPALCSHGDLIPKMIRRMIAAGMKAPASGASQKGSVWELEVDGARVTTGRYHPPGPAPDDA